MSDKESSEIMRDLLSHAIPVNPSPQTGYVTREEFVATVRTIESKIENSALKTKQWVLTACVAILVSGVSGYVSLMNKLDRVTEALPILIQKQEARGPWMQRQEQRDSMQDEILKKLDKDYQPLPYQPPPL